jgi:hypothetical protein
MKIGRGKNISQRKKIIFYFVFATYNFIISFTKSAKSPSLPLWARQLKKNKNFIFDNYNFAKKIASNE